MQIFRQRIQEVRESKGLSKSEIAKLLNIHPQTWHKYESGISAMSLETFRNFCETLKIDANWLLGLSDEP